MKFIIILSGLLFTLCSCVDKSIDFEKEVESISLIMAKDLVVAKRKTENLISNFPNKAEPYNILSWIYFLEGKLDSAFLLNSAAIRLDSLNAEILTTHGYIYEEWGKHEVSYRYFKRAFLIDSMSTIAYRGICLHYLRNGNYPRASYLAEKGFKIDGSLDLALVGMVVADITKDSTTFEFYKTILLESNDSLRVSEAVEYIKSISSRAEL